MAKFRWVVGDRRGRWRATRREVLKNALECGFVVADPESGSLKPAADLVVEEKES